MGFIPPQLSVTSNGGKGNGGKGNGDKKDKGGKG